MSAWPIVAGRLRPDSERITPEQRHLLVPPRHVAGGIETERFDGRVAVIPHRRRYRPDDVGARLVARSPRCRCLGLPGRPTGGAARGTADRTRRRGSATREMTTVLPGTSPSIGWCRSIVWLDGIVVLATTRRASTPAPHEPTVDSRGDARFDDGPRTSSRVFRMRGLRGHIFGDRRGECLSAQLGDHVVGRFARPVTPRRALPRSRSRRRSRHGSSAVGLERRIAEDDTARASVVSLRSVVEGHSASTRGSASPSGSSVDLICRLTLASMRRLSTVVNTALHAASGGRSWVPSGRVIRIDPSGCRSTW